MVRNWLEQEKSHLCGFDENLEKYKKVMDITLGLIILNTFGTIGKESKFS